MRFYQRLLVTCDFTCDFWFICVEFSLNSCVVDDGLSVVHGSMARGESDLNVVTTEPLKQTTGGVSTIKRGGGGSQEDVNKASSRNHSRSSTPGSIAPEVSEKKETPRVMRPAYMVQAPPKQRRYDSALFIFLV